MYYVWCKIRLNFNLYIYEKEILETAVDLAVKETYIGIKNNMVALLQRNT